MKINVSKTQEMIVDYTKNKTTHPAIEINGKKVERVEEVKLAGVIIQSNLKWDSHVSAIIKKASSRLHFLVMLKRSGLHPSELLTFYKTIIRPVVEYAAPVWSTVTKLQIIKNETIQRRALKIIFPGKHYHEILSDQNLQSLNDRR